jgi:hypothetical protein
MPTEIEDQIASYFAWVESQTGFSLHAPEVAQASTPLLRADEFTTNGRSNADEAPVIELDAPGRRRRRSTRIRVAALCGVAAAVLVGVIVIANRPAAEPRLPANSVPTTDPQTQAEEASRRAREQAQADAQRALEAQQAAEAARKAAETASTTTVVLPDNASSTDAVAVQALPGSVIQNARMTSPTTGWVVTDDAIARTTDGGATWQARSFPPLLNSTTGTLSFILDDDHAWAMRVDGDGRVVMRSATGAATGLAVAPFDPGFSGGTPAGIVFTDDQNGHVSIVEPGKNPSGRAAVLRASDGGATFTLVDPDAPVPLAFIDSQTGWGSGAGLFVTTDGASTWTQVKPPLWDATGPDPNGPSYHIVLASPELTVVKVVSPTGTQAQVAYAATNDLGKTWRDVAPPNTGESDNSGSQSMLTTVSAANWFGIAQGDGTDAILWTTTDGGANYHSTHLPFPAVTITMSTMTTEWATTATDIRSTADGGATWTKVADIAVPG